MADRPTEGSWQNALSELRAASRDYDQSTADVSARELGEGMEALAWFRLRRAVDEYEQAREDFLRGLVIDQ
jgi:hypothetical protein